MVVNPADVPLTDKDKKRKSDRIDALKISRHLPNNMLRPTYIPSIKMEHARALVRQRIGLVRTRRDAKAKYGVF